MKITFENITYTLDTQNKNFQKGDKLLQHYECFDIEGWAVIEVKSDKEGKFHSIVSDTYKIKSAEK